ncbi:MULTISPECIES: TonB-dependent receptor [unclassified Colwellia]|uniref:TonB-dependent receptor n=1 Tax=unclassified Colwellia TaxID=196834 RepID=UPI0015F53164|nr:MULTISPECIES: TonB-dependent receptor [unclassified Colwellia]MBA6379851.1 TonB-dependent receptor [Colwellia sp. BRX10-7]MBA6386579.1 TonB-dependent receptor [Colwellia sp. BRX10-2]MBA6401689.1 TonB-dependent receptor [Colwellia sp. BRX10-5]MBA6406280.1 TonB-dependent receptor [Colwellia sp. BRX10-1]
MSNVQFSLKKPTGNFNSSLFLMSTLSCTVSAGEPQALQSAQDASLHDKDIEVIIVTAQKRVENILEVPISIASFNSETIVKTGIRQLNEIAEFVPNLSMTTTNDFSSSITIRGVGSSSRNIGFDARVGLYLDGVYVGQSPAHNQDLLDLERIEVLRGPQGTLFGKNNVAGSINLISQKPEDEFGSTVGFSVGNYDLKQITAMVNAPIGDNVATKFSFNQYERAGFTENVTTGNWLNEQDSYAYRGQIKATPFDNIEVNFSFDRLHSDRLSFDGEPITNTLGNAKNSESSARNKVSFDVDPHENRDIKGEILNIDWDINNNYSIKSITGHRDVYVQYINDFDFSTESVSYLDYIDDYDQWSQELQLISPEGDFQYVAGLYYYQQDAHTRRLPTVGDETLSLFTGVPRSAVEFGASLGDPTSIFMLAAFHPGNISTVGDVETTSYAAFFNSNYQFNDDVTLDLGFRYSREEKNVDWTISSIDPVTSIPVIPIFELANGQVVDKRSDNDFSPLVSLNYRLGEQINTYIKYATGYKSGGYNVDFLTQAQLDAGIEFDKETVESYEIGIKGHLFDQRVTFSSAAFYSTYDDYQINQLINLAAGTTALSIRNAAKVETRGLEFDLQYRLTSDLSINVAVGLLDAEFAKFPGGGSNGEDLSGAKLSGVSDFTFNLSAQYYYLLPALNAELSLLLSYNYQDDYNTDLDGLSQITLANGDAIAIGQVEGFGIVNASVGIEPLGSGVSLFLWARNLASENSAIIVGEKSFFGTRRNVYVSPRTFGLTVKYTF